LKKKLLIVLSYYYPYVSGLSEQARLQVESISNEYDITILTGQHNKSLSLVENDHIKIIRAKPLFFIHKGYISLDIIFKYFKLIKKNDIIMFHLPMFDSGLLSFFTTSKKKIISMYHCDIYPEKNIVDKLIVFLTNLSCKITLRKSEKIIVTSDDYARGSAILKKFSKKWVEISLLIKDIEYKEKNIRSEELKIGFLGRFVKEKGIDILLESVPEVIKDYPKVIFILSGEFKNIAGGTIYNQLKEKIEKYKGNIILTGNLDENKLSDFYNSLDLFILPSVNSYEAFGMVQVEAMKAGAMVIATNMRGVRVPILRTNNGLLVEPGDYLDLSKKIKECLFILKNNGISRKNISLKTNEIFDNKDSVNKLKKILNNL